jgi:flagellar biosynthesis protein FliR
MKQPPAFKRPRQATPALRATRAPQPARPEPAERASAPILRTSRRRFLTPFRIGVGIAFVGSLVFIAIGIVNRNANQIPILVAGLAVLALTMTAITLACVLAVIRAGRDGRDSTAFWAALAGGVAALGAAGSAAAAVVMAAVWGSAAK